MAFGGIIGKQTTTYTNEEIDGMIQGLQQQIGGSLSYVYGTYVGQGRGGENNASYLDFPDGVPKVLFIWAQFPYRSNNVSNGAFGYIPIFGSTDEEIRGYSFGHFFYNSTNSAATPNYLLGCVARDNRVYWYSKGTGANPIIQLDVSGVNYCYLGLK